MARKRRKLKPRYTVNMTMHAWNLARAGAALTVEVRDRDEHLGTIEIGQGSFRWKPAHGKLGFKRIAWDRLAAALNEHY